MIAPLPYDALAPAPGVGTASYDYPVAPVVYEPDPRAPEPYPTSSPPASSTPTSSPPASSTPTSSDGGGLVVDMGGGAFLPSSEGGGGYSGGGSTVGGWPHPAGGSGAPARDLTGYVDLIKNFPGYALALLVGVALVLILIRAS